MTMHVADIPHLLTDRLKSLSEFDMIAWVATWERFEDDDQKFDDEHMYIVRAIQLSFCLPTIIQMSMSIYIGAKYTQYDIDSMLIAGVMIALLGALEFGRLNAILLNARNFQFTSHYLYLTVATVVCIVAFQFMVIVVTLVEEDRAAQLCVTFMTFSIFPTLYVLFSCAQAYRITLCSRNSNNILTPEALDPL